MKDALDSLLTLEIPAEIGSIEHIVERDSGDSSRFICHICKKHHNKNHNPQVKNISGHFTSKTHSANMKKSQLEEADNIIRVYYGEEPLFLQNGEKEDQEPRQSPPETSSGLSTDERAFKIDLTGFMIKEKIPFSKSDSILIFIQDILRKYQPKMLLDAEISKETVTKIARDCISASIKETLFNDLKTSPYSLSLDEASDFYKNSYLALCAKFLPSKGGEKPVTKLISIIELTSGKTGEALAHAIEEEVLSKDPLISQNFMGIVSDEAQAMVGSKAGLGAILKRQYKHIVCRADLSHKFHNVCKTVVKRFPSEVLQIVSSVTSYFRFSCQRRYKLRAIQEKLRRDPILEILKYTEVRWLSLSQCLERILELWEPIKTCFRENKEYEELEKLSTKNKLKLRLAADLLSYINHYNLEFQKNDLLYDEIILGLEESLRVFGNHIFPEQLTHKKILQLIPKDTSDLKILEESSLETQDFMNQWLTSHNETNIIFKAYIKELEEAAEAAEVAVKAENEEERKAAEAAEMAEDEDKKEAAESAETTELKKAEEDAIVEENEQIKKGGDNERLRKAIESEEIPQDPTEIQIEYKKIQEEFQDLLQLFEALKQWIFEVLIEMKRRLPFEDPLSDQIRVVFLENFDKEAWDKLREAFPNIIEPQQISSFELELKIFKANFATIKDEHKSSKATILSTWNLLSQKYKHLSKLAKALLVLPSSTVPVERVFSQLKDVKGPKRSRLTTDNLEASLIIYQEFHSFKVKVTDDMLKRYEGLWKKKVEKSKTIIKDQEQKIIEMIDPSNRLSGQGISESGDPIKGGGVGPYKRKPGPLQRALDDLGPPVQVILYGLLAKKVKTNQ